MKAFTKKETMNSLKILILSLLIGFGVNVVHSASTWAGPSGAPTSCTTGQQGCDAPLHAGQAGQIKQGGLTVANYSETLVGLAVMNGNVGIGTSAPTKKLDVVGAVKGTELCIGSDCRTSWPVGGSSGGGISGSGAAGYIPRFIGATPATTLQSSGIYQDSGGNVGIGTDNVQQKLTVAGNLRLNGGYPYLMLKPDGWAEPVYIQTNLTDSGTVSGDNVWLSAGAGRSWLFYSGGASGIGPLFKIKSDATVKIPGGSPAAGKVLTASDDSGNSAWEPTSVLCSNASTASQCVSARTSDGWRAISCRMTHGTATVGGSPYWNGSKWIARSGDTLPDCHGGTVLVVRIGPSL